MKERRGIVVAGSKVTFVVGDVSNRESKPVKIISDISMPTPERLAALEWGFRWLATQLPSPARFQRGGQKPDEGAKLITEAFADHQAAKDDATMHYRAPLAAAVDELIGPVVDDVLSLEEGEPSPPSTGKAEPAPGDGAQLLGQFAHEKRAKSRR